MIYYPPLLSTLHINPRIVIFYTSSTWTCWKNKNCLHLGKLLRIYIVGMSPLFDQKFWTYIMIKTIFWQFFSLWQLIPDFMTWKFSELWRFVNLLPPNQRKKKTKKKPKKKTNQETHDSEYQRNLGS